MKRIGGMLMVALLLSACGKKEPETPSVKPSERLPSFESLTRGARLYQEHCAQCHGPEAQGHPDWQNPQVAAAPPLNGSGNEWKRSQRELLNIIQNGAKRHGEWVMPAWKGRLSDLEIEDIVTWFQALWPADVYERWRKANVSSAPSA